jgi:hypothetical protein
MSNWNIPSQGLPFPIRRREEGTSYIDSVKRKSEKKIKPLKTIDWD